MKKPPAYSIYQEFDKNIEMLSNEDAGLLFKAINRFVFHDETPDFDNSVKDGIKFTWTTIESKLRRDKKHYALKCVKSAYASDTKQYPDLFMNYVSWFEWRKARYKNCIDPILEGITIEDMLILDSEKAYKDAKRSNDIE